MDKDTWYDFRANFRRDQTDFNYNLLANPLNPSTSNPNITRYLFASHLRNPPANQRLRPDGAATVED